MLPQGILGARLRRCFLQEEICRLGFDTQFFGKSAKRRVGMWRTICGSCIFELVGDVGVAQSPPRTELDDYAEPREMALHEVKRIAPRWQGCTGSLVEGNGWQGPWEAPQLLWAWASGP